ncbi:MAG: sensor histidine kinase [Pyrinomonadaceae bacterium]
MLSKISEFQKVSMSSAYFIATVLVGLACIFTSGLWLLVDRPISAPLFLGAIVLSSWIGGIRVGIFASFLSGLAIDYFFVQPFHQFTGSRDELVRLILFFGEGVLLSYLVERLRIASEDIKKSREELRELTKYQQTLRESEQKRIALEIHDELGQALTGLKMDAHFLGERIAVMEPATDREKALDDMGELAKRIDKTLVSVRRITSELRPSILDDFGLVAASEWQVKEFERTTTIKCDFSSNVDELDLGSDSNTAVFRILQEALTNVARHAAATSVSIGLSRLPNIVKMTVADNGKGIGIDNQIGIQTLGLLGMRERTRLIGGELDINQRPSGGTCIELRVPLNKTLALDK